MTKRAVVLSLIVVIGFLNGCSHFSHDNAIEELAEDLIEDSTGLDIDLTSEDGQ